MRWLSISRLSDAIRSWTRRRRLRRQWLQAVRRRQLLDRWLWVPLVHRALPNNAHAGERRADWRICGVRLGSLDSLIPSRLIRWWHSPPEILRRRRMLLLLLSHGIRLFLSHCSERWSRRSSGSTSPR